MPEDVTANPSNAPLSHLLKSLTAGQIWKLVGIVVGTLVGAFYFGFWISEQTSNFELRAKDDAVRERDARIAQIETENGRHEKELLFLNKKTRLLSLLVLFDNTKRKLDRLNDEQERDPDNPELETKFEKTMVEMGTLRKNFTEFGRSMDEQIGVSSTSEVKIQLGKGISQPTIKFVEDRSVWPLHAELFAMEN